MNELGKPARVFDPSSVENLRRHLKLSQDRFAKLLDVSPTTIANWERGRVVAPAAYLVEHMRKLYRVNLLDEPWFFKEAEDE